jgi:DmsE family decaheme c-type cytochrome
MKLPSVRTIGFVGLAILTIGFLTAANSAPQSAEKDTCLECHEDAGKTFPANPHAVTNSCTGCHDNEAEHLEEGGGQNIFAFKAENNANAKSQKCLSCHTKSNSRYFASSHGKASMDCMECHIIHTEAPKPALLKTSSTKSCYMCHEDVFSKFQLNERHRLQEGIMSCTTCHNPHEPSARTRLAGFKHQSCLKCHTDKGGPYLYEHDASRIEGCTACHDVHGSPNRHMLTMQSTSDLCFSCHTTAVSWHARFNSESTNCVVCHSTIHGSNLSKIFLK